MVLARSMKASVFSVGLQYSDTCGRKLLLARSVPDTGRSGASPIPPPVVLKSTALKPSPSTSVSVTA
ncbi:hypothetical protein D3C73_1133510 [compost metagenome]